MSSGRRIPVRLVDPRCDPLTIRELGPNGYDTFQVISAEEAARLADLDDDAFGRLLLESAIPGAGHRSNRASEPPRPRPLLPREARRPVNEISRAIALLVFVFVLSLTACVVAVFLYDMAHPDEFAPPPVPPSFVKGVLT